MSIQKYYDLIPYEYDGESKRKWVHLEATFAHNSKKYNFCIHV